MGRSTGSRGSSTKSKPSNASSSAHQSSTGKRGRNQDGNPSPNSSPEKKKLATEMNDDDNLSSASSSRQTYRPPPPVDYQPEFVTPNPFQPLAPRDEEDMEEEVITDQIKPPEINIKTVTNFLNVCKTISAVVGEQSFSCKARLNALTIQATDTDTYRKIVKHLQAIGMEFYTYQFREEKAYRVVIRHLHPSTPIDLIKEELTKIGFDVLDACNVIQRSTKTPLPLFFVNLKPAPNNKDIFSLKRLLYTSVKVEEPHKKDDVIQCTRCQGFNHSRKYCSLKPVCVKCAGAHLTSECSKTRDTPATCAHCHQAHPANYKGCTVYKEIVTRVRRSRSQSAQRAVTRPPPSQPAAIQPPAVPSTSHPSQPSGPRELPTGLPTLQHPPSVNPARPTYASATSPNQHSPAPPLTPSNLPPRPSRVYIPPPNPSTDLTTALNNLNLLIHNLQALIAPLTDLLLKVTSILSTTHP